MDFDKNYLLIDDDLHRLLDADMYLYVAHAYCMAGQCRIRYNEQDFLFKEGDLLLVPAMKLVQEVEPAEGFRVMAVYAHSDFRTLCIPNSNYGPRASMSLMLNPIIPLQGWEREACLRDMQNIRFRYEGDENEFYPDIMMNAMQALILDCYQFHVHGGQGQRISPIHAGLMGSFMQMLERGAFREHRDIGYYASELCVSTKYFSELCKRLSGHTASQWINRYAVLEMRRLLKDTTLSMSEIADYFCFSSPSHFTHFFYGQTGILPSDFRK